MFHGNYVCIMYRNKLTVLLIVIIYFEMSETCRTYNVRQKGKTKQQGGGIPKCNPECGNGTCVDVNKCNCLNGYELREEASPQCVPLCRDCCGECVAFINSWKSYTIHLTAENRRCDCLYYCGNKCSKIGSSHSNSDRAIFKIKQTEITHMQKTHTLKRSLKIYNFTIEDNMQATRNNNSVAKTNKCSSNFTLLYTSVGANIVLLLIVLIIVYLFGKYKCLGGNDRTNKHNTSDCNGQRGYVDMGGYFLINQTVIKDESSNKASNDYDYILQVSQLPTDQKFNDEIPPNK